MIASIDNAIIIGIRKTIIKPVNIPK